MHVGFSLLIGWSLARLVRRRALHPGLFGGQVHVLELVVGDFKEVAKGGGGQRGHGLSKE